MNNVVALQPQRSLRDYTPSQLALIRKTVAKDCNPDEFNLFVEICKRVGLDPFRKQIYANVYNKNDDKKRQLVIITAIDGLRAVAARNGDYLPDEDEPQIVTDPELVNPDTNPKGIMKAIVRVKKRAPDGAWHHIAGSALWEEFAPLDEIVDWVDTGEIWEDSGKPKKSRVGTGVFKLDASNPNSFWRRMGHHMLAKCAEAQALRKGWPEDLSGIYTPEEVAAAEMRDITPSEELEQAAIEDRLGRIGAKRTVPFQWAAGAEIQYVPIGQSVDRVLEFLKNAESATQVEAWQRINAIGLRELWAISKSDGLEVKKAIEQRVSALSRESA